MVRDAKHTPGPWALGKPYGQNNIEIVGDNHSRLIGTVLVKRWGHCENPSRPRWDDWPEGEANAHLIAAAPEMYEVLEALVTASYDVTPASEMDELWRLAERVLAKARGQSLGQTIVRAVQTDVGIAHVDYGARLDCPCPDLCYGEMCVAPDICHDPEIHRNPDEWRRRLEAIKRELDGEEGEAS